MNPFWQKVLGTVGAVGIYLVGHKFPDLQAELWPLAGAVAGGMWVRSPGDTKAEP
jgi:hypothetical protein